MSEINVHTKPVTTSAPSVWRNPSFIILFAASGIIALGNQIYELALPLILYELTKSPVAMSTMRGIEFLPNLFLAMFIGVLMDRVHKKWWSIGSIVLQVILLLALFLSFQYGQPSIYVLYGCGFILMTLSYAFRNASAGMVKQSVPTPLLTSANAALGFTTTLITIMGAALSGMLLMLSNLYTGLLITAILLAISCIILLPLHSAPVSRGTSPQGFWVDFKEGWIELRRNHMLLVISITVIFLNATSGMVDATVIFYAKDTLQLRNLELGLVLSAAGVGGLIGSLVVSSLRRKYSAGVLIVVTTLLQGFAFLILGLFHSTYGLAVGLFLSGIFQTISTICIWTFRQESTPHHMIGRISGITGSLFKLGMPLAIWGSGWISELSNPALVFGIAAAANVIIFICCRYSVLWDRKGT
ncbi:MULTISPECIES: MFS transporter [Paenibacillus]|uniref:Na+/melibiose symporter-like transporter n=1 Tax=Paenibacillus pabuli TaxID=1472 RepID=A0A855YBQ4_9BACL|nr:MULTISPECIES: MFS transporter [Paenibacillus]PWW43314.1 Na+/melibiose symporter-like transporter [Paenibacillus pabuli]PXW09221.1 Na+/melibiose symporter-like transporter [Paenibacillus taichungensis]